MEMFKRDLCKTSNFVEIAEGEKLTRRNITKYFEDLILSLTMSSAKRPSFAEVSKWFFLLNNGERFHMFKKWVAGRHEIPEKSTNEFGIDLKNGYSPAK